MNASPHLAPNWLHMPPRISTIQIKQDKIRDIIGPGGKGYPRDYCGMWRENEC